METINLICFNCKHFRKYVGGCDAFPDGIPDRIQVENKHDEPLPGQGNSVVFEFGQPQDLFDEQD